MIELIFLKTLKHFFHLYTVLFLGIFTTILIIILLVTTVKFYMFIEKEEQNPESDFIVFWVLLTFFFVRIFMLVLLAYCPWYLQLFVKGHRCLKGYYHPKKGGYHKVINDDDQEGGDGL